MDYDFVAYFIALILAVGIRCIWGAITWKINDYKGYASGGFWWGFFLNLIGVIVVACKPNVSSYKITGWKCACGRVHSDYVTTCSCGRTASRTDGAHNTASVPDGGWRCTCGRAHPAYASSCVCGVTKREATAGAAKPAPTPATNEQNTVNLLKEYKSLLDSGAITQEEFEAKKAQLLER